MKKSAGTAIALIAVFLGYKAIIPAHAAPPQQRKYRITVMPLNQNQGYYVCVGLPTLVPGSAYAWQFYDEVLHCETIIQGPLLIQAGDNLRE